MRWLNVSVALWLACCATFVHAGEPGLRIDEMALTEGEISWNGRAEWAPGDVVYVRIVLSGLTRSEAGRIQVRESLELLDPDGKLLLEARDLLSVEREVAAEPTAVELVNHFRIPEGLAPGAYAARVRCNDALSGASVSAELPFVVKATPDAAFRIERFELVALRGADGAEGAAARVDARLVGYRTDPEGRYWIEADLLLIDTTGKVALRWDRVLVRHEHGELRGLPLKLSLDLALPEPSAPGNWALELRVRDRIASAEAVQRATWTKR